MTTSEEPATDAELEQLLAAAIGCLEDGGEAALAEFLTEHAAAAPRVREALADLELVDRYSTVNQSTPQRFGEFVVRSELGAGGMGVVYLAEQTSLGREVALKVVRPELLLFDGSKERFLREVDAVARIQHAAIVPILATGTEDGVPWYAMPKLPGRSGEEIVRHFADAEPTALTGADLRRFLLGPDGPEVGRAGGSADSTRGSQVFAGPWWRAVTAAFASAVDGIHHAHLSGIVHRDLKPSNVMFAADGSAVVLDFGLAQVQGSARLTRTGGAAGSPAYMAPEQVRGEPADERTDVYGLGATLACLLGLRLPFAGRDEGELRVQILTGQRRELRRRAGLPVELSIVIARAMDVDRTRRYGDAAALAADLRSVLDGRPIAARRLPFFLRVRRFAGRHRSVSVAIALLMVFAVLVPALLLVQAEAANTRLQKQVERSDASVALTIDAVDGLLLELSVNELRNHPATQEVALRLLRRAENLFAEIRDDERHHERVERLQTRALAQIVVFESLLGNAAAATAAAERFIELATARLAVAEDPSLRLKLGSARAELAEQWFRSGRIDEARELVELARADFLAVGDDPPTRRAAVQELAMLEVVAGGIERAAGNHAESSAAFRRAVAVSAPMHSEAEPFLANQLARVFLARCLRRAQEYQEALDMIDAVIAELPPVVDTSAERGWPVPRSVRAFALAERFQICMYGGAGNRALRAGPDALAAMADLLSDYPGAAAHRRERAVVAGNLGLVHIRTGEDFVAAEPLLRLGIADLERLRAEDPSEPLARQFLVQQYKTLTFVLRKTAQWGELADFARRLAAIRGEPENRRRAGSELVHCARGHGLGTKAANALLREAMGLLLAARRAGSEFDATTAHYAPLRDLPGWDELAGQ